MNNVHKIVLVSFLLLTACAPQGESETAIIGNLVPYLTGTPKPTSSQPEGLVLSNQTLLPSATPFAYTVKAGDTMSQIAEKFNVSLDALLLANPNVDPNGMPVGQNLKIPSSPNNPSGEATPTAATFLVQQIACHPTADRGLWCFVLAHNDSSVIIEDITAQVTLVDSQGKVFTSQTASTPLNILPPGESLPISVFFKPDVPSNVQPQVQILTAIQLLPGDSRYLPATIHNTLVQVDWSGFSAQVDGQILLPADSKPASVIWVAAVVFNTDGNICGVRRWESSAGPAPGGKLPFSFIVSSVAGRIGRVEFVVEARL